MKYTYYPRSHTESLVCRSVLCLIGAAALVCFGVIFLLATFDVLVK
jgi:hypothetical protein